MKVERLGLVFSYIIQRFFVRILEFLYRWYVVSGKSIANSAIRKLKSFERTFALKITIRNFFKPLYGDESFIGRIFGIFFRTVRIFTALLFYLFFISVVIVVYLVWMLLPIYIISKIIIP